MDSQILLILAQDGLTNGAIYVLLAVALILVFGVTRVVLIPQGEFVSYGALTLASLQLGVMPGTVWLLLILAGIAAIMETYRLLSSGAGRELSRVLAMTLVPPVAIAALVKICLPLKLALGWQVLLAILIVTPLGPLVYRVAFRPLADATVLVLLIAAVAVHFVLVGLGLLFFGAEGVRTPPFSAAQLTFGTLNVSGQSLWVYATSFVFIALLAWFWKEPYRGHGATRLTRWGTGLHDRFLLPWFCEQDIRAVVGPCYDRRMEEYRVGLGPTTGDEVYHGIVWPLLGAEDEATDAAGEIEAVLREAGVKDVLFLDHHFPMEFCDDCGAPLFPNREAELVHAEMPEQAAANSQALH